MQYDRLTSETKLAETLKTIDKRIKSLETKGTGTISWMDESGVETVIGELPDGTTGFQPFVGDIEPPPVATAPTVTAVPGGITVAWDGLFVNNAEKPRDFTHVNIIGYKVVDSVTVLTLTLGLIRTGTESVTITPGDIAVGETWQFALEAVDYNNNKAAASDKSPLTTMLSVVYDGGVSDALAELDAATAAAAQAAVNAQDAADAAQAEADELLINLGSTNAAVTAAQLKADQAFNNAVAAATAAGNAQTSADSKSTVWYQDNAPAGIGHSDGDVWFDTNDGNKPNVWVGAPTNAWQSARDAAIATAQSKADDAFSVANGKTTTYYQTTQPTGGTYVKGDMWIDTDNNYKLYTYPGTGTTWVLAQDAAAAKAEAILAAATDATTKATDAQTAAIAAAALDATAKADAAKAVALTAVQNAENKVVNGSFELDYDGWVRSGTSIDTAVFRSGTKSLQTTGTGSVHQNGFPVVVGSTWRMDFFYKTEASYVNGSNGGLRLQRSTDGGVNYSDVATTNLSNNTNWTNTSVDYLVPAGTTHLRPRLAFAYTVGPKAWVDDVRLIDVTTIKTLEADAQTKATAAQNAAIAAAATDATTKSATAKAEAIAAAGTDASTKAATAKSEAISAAATDAATKAATAKSEAISAAISDATTRAANAKAEAIAAAATDATTKANTAKTDAISAAATDASTKATNAQQAAIDAAAADAASKAATAKSEAIAAAATDAQSKADAAEQAAIDAAAITAQLKADGAEQAAIDAAALDAQQKADAAKAAAEAAAAITAQAKADAAQAAAVAAAAITAQQKADAAQDAALQAAAKMNAFSGNASFEDWTSTLPNGFTAFTTGPTKETSIVRSGKQSARWNLTDTTTQAGLSFSGGVVAGHLPNLEYYTVEIEFYLVSGGLGGSGMILDWAGMTNNRAQINLASEFPTVNTGKWYKLTKVLRRPTNATGTWTNMSGYLMAQWSGHGTGAVKNIIFDYLNIRPATTEEITSYGQPGAIATAKSEAIGAAATDATTKATNAQTAAVAAAAADATAKADAAEQAAIVAAELDAEAKAATAKSEAISAAATDAQAKADAAEQAAIDAAAITAQLKADGAEQAAIDAAAITAQQKADAAEQAAIDAAAITAQAKADAAKAQAIAAAATDAQTRATEAKTQAIEAAATDATTKADAAQRAAIQAQGYQLNPSFEDWTGTIPANYTTFVTNPTKETTTVLTGKNAVRFNCTDTTTQRGLQFNAALAHAPYFEYVTVEVDVRLDSGTSFGGSGVLVDWGGMTGANRATLSLAAEIPAPVTGRWYRIVKVFRKPATATGTFTSYSAWLMGQYPAGMGTQAIKNVIFDWINVRPATTEEITAFGTPASITALSDTVNTKTKSWFQPGQPPLTGNTTGDLWFDTDDGNKPYIWNGAWTSAQDASIATAQSAATTAQTSANGKNKVIYSTSAASGTTGYIAGDTWYQRDSVDATKIIAQWEFVTTPSPAWATRQLNHQVVASIDAAKITVGNLDVANRIAANAITVNKLMVGDFTNLASDGYFTDLSKKSWIGSGTVVTETNAPNKLRIVTAASGNNDQANLNSFQVEGGEQVYVDALVYGEATNVGGGGPNVHLAVSMLDGTTLWPSVSLTRAAVQGAWTPLKGTITLPANSKTAKVELAVSFSADAVGNTYYFREVSVRRKATGELIVDGAIKAGSAIIEEGAIGNAHIGNLAVGTAEMQNLAVTAAKIDDLAVTNAKINDLHADKITAGTIAAARLDADSIRSKIIEADYIAATDIFAPNSVTSASGIFGTMDASVITAGTIAAARLDAAIVRSKLIEADYLIATDIFAPNSITSASGIFGTMDASVITAGTIAAARLDAEVVKSKLIEASYINATDIFAQNSITSASGIFGTMDASIINAGTIGADRLDANTIKAKLIAADYLVATDIFAPNSITSASGIFGTMNASVINAGTIAADRLDAETVKSKLIEASLINAVDILASNSITATNGIIGSLDVSKVTTGTLSGSFITAKSIKTDRLVITSTDNLVLEADFSNNGSSWDLGAAYKFIMPTRGRGGLPALRFVGSTSVVTALNKDNKFSVDDASRFRGAISVKSTEALPIGAVKMILRCYTAVGGPTDVTVVSNEDALVVDTWTTLTGISPALPTDTLSVEILLSVLNGTTTTWTEVDYVSLTRAADATLVVDGAINGQTITGATIRTADPAQAGARVEMDEDGLRAYDLTNTKYLDASATGLTLTGKLNALGNAGNNFLDTVIGPTSQSRRNSNTVTPFPGISFIPNAESSYTPNRMVPGMQAINSTTVMIQGGEPEGYVPDGPDTWPSNIQVAQNTINLNANGGSMYLSSSSTMTLQSGLGAVVVDGTSLTLNARTTAGIKLRSYGPISFGEYATNAVVDVTGFKSINGVDWSDDGRTSVTPTNGWTHFGGGYGYVQVKEFAPGIVLLQGLMRAPATGRTDGMVIGTIPLEHRPNRHQNMPVTIRTNQAGAAANGPGLVQINTNGNVHLFCDMTYIVYVNFSNSYFLVSP